MKIRFIRDGSEGKINKWRYKKDDEPLLPDYLAQQAIDEDLAIEIKKPVKENEMNPTALRQLDQAKRERDVL